MVSNRMTLGVFLLLIFFTSCEDKPVRKNIGYGSSVDISANDLYKLLEKEEDPITLVRSGDIVLRAGTGPYSYTLANLNKRDKTWSHCGIVLVENGYPFVYHSIGGEDNPGMRLRRDSVQVFFAVRYCMGMGIARYDSGTIDTNKLSQAVHGYYERKPQFDMQFDLATDDKLYCSEFVYKAIIKATGDTAFLPTSETQGRRYVGIDDLFLNPHARLVWKVLFK